MPDRKIQLTSPTMLFETLEAILSCREGCTTRQIVGYTGKSQEYVRRALNIGIELGCIERVRDTFAVTPGIEMGSPSNLIKSLLAKYEPFVFYCLRISNGDRSLVAARKTKTVFGIANSEDDVDGFFRGWGRFAGLLEEEDGEVTLRFSISTPVGKLLTDGVEDEISARAFVLECLGTHIDKVDSNEVELISSALAHFKQEPRHSVDDAGRALEDFLRDFSRILEIDVRRRNGIIEIVNELVGKRPNALHPKQWDILRVMGTMRNLSIHSKDKGTERAWEISSDFALSFCLLCVRIMYSCLEYHYNSGAQSI